MLHRNDLFLLIVLVSCGVFARASVAAPSVKNLGGAVSSGTQSNAGGESQMKLSPTTQRTPSLRMSGSTMESGSKLTNDAGNATSKTNADYARLSGLHSNLIKGIGSKLSSNYNAQPRNPDTSDLTQRVINLESEIATKQNILEPGTGIDIDGDTIGVTAEIAALPARLNTMDQDLADLNDKIDGAHYYTISDAQEYMEQNYYDKTYMNTVINQLSSLNVVSQFHPGFLLGNQ